MRSVLELGDSKSKWDNLRRGYRSERKLPTRTACGFLFPKLGRDETDGAGGYIGQKGKKIQKMTRGLGKRK
ncbi:MAG: hypothetical protein ACE5I5_10425 [Candidatus Heimdallarchaeota archaeon]